MTTCIAPNCPSDATVGAVFCEPHLCAPRYTRAGWVSAARRRQERKVEASNIWKKLWVGSKPPFDQDLPKIDTLVLCATELQPARVAFHGQTLRCALPDAQLTSNELQRALITGREVATQLAANKTVLVTCAQGRNRSAFVAAIALGHLTRMSATQIVDLVRAKRQKQALANPYFVAYLDKFITPERAEVHSPGKARIIRRT